MKKELLHLQDVSKFHHSYEVFRNLSFDVFAGETVGILIPPMSGKTTLTRILLGDEDYTGSIYYKGQPVAGTLKKYNSDHEILCLTNNSPLIPNLTISENMFLMPGRCHRPFLNAKRDNSTAQRYLAELGLTVSASELVRNTDLYTQHMVQLARAIQDGVHLIVFDDPSVYYDQKQLEEVQDTLRLLRKKEIAVLWLAASAFPFQTDLLDRVIIIEDYRKVRTVFHPEQLHAAAPSGWKPETAFINRSAISGENDCALQMEEVSATGLAPVSLTLNKGSAIGLYAERVRTLQRFGNIFLPWAGETPQGLFRIGENQRKGKEIYADYGKRYVLLNDSFAHDLLLEERSIIDNVYLPISWSRRMNPLSVNTGFQRALQQEIWERLGIRPDQQQHPASELNLSHTQELILFRIELQRPAFILYCSSYSQTENSLQELLGMYFQRYLKSGIGILIAAPGLERFAPILAGEHKVNTV